MDINVVHIFGAICMALAALIACTNFYLSFVRPFYFWLKKKSCKFDSGLPGIGTIFLIIGALLLPTNSYLAGLAVLIVLFDTGGLPWFVGVMIYRSIFPLKPN
jgi:hypothetical protein